MIVVDTNVVSELMRVQPSAAVLDWVDRQTPSELFTTAITVAEIRYGIERLPEGRRREDLATTAAEIFATFADQVLAFDVRAAARYGTIVAARDHAGAPIAGFDAQIAAICDVHTATLASRNDKDFEGTGIEVVNPWQARV